jgi:hypothetical protein
LAGLLLVFLIAVVPAKALQPELKYPFFRANKPCYLTSEAAGPWMPGWAREYQGGDDRICYYVATIKILGLSENAGISFEPAWCPDQECAGLEMDFWRVEYPGEEFDVGYPIPAGAGRLTINGEVEDVFLLERKNPFYK